MPDSRAETPPTRRSLRLARQAAEREAARATGPSHGHVPSPAPAPAPTFELKQLPVTRKKMTPPPTTAPADAGETTLPRSRARRIVATAAAACSALGLTGVLALPSTAAPATTGKAALMQQQKLFSTAGGDAVEAGDLEALSGVLIEDTGVDGASFVNFTDAAVQYPFPSGVPLTDGFGYRTAPVAQFHDAQDFAAADGTPVQAIADGTVAEAGFSGDGCGFGLLLKHRIGDMDVESRYCHMQINSNALAVGDRVSVGQQVGRVGATGMAFGAHLHLVIRVEGKPVDPMPFLDEQNRLTRPSAKR